MHREKCKVDHLSFHVRKLEKRRANSTQSKQRKINNKNQQKSMKLKTGMNRERSQKLVL